MNEVDRNNATTRPGTTLLEVSDLRTHFFGRDRVVPAVDGVDFSVGTGRTVCVVGESGCGKSVTARSILGLVDVPGRIVSGSIRWHPPDGEPIDLASLDPKGVRLRAIRGNDISMVFQEPMASLSPMWTVGAQIIEVVRLHLGLDKRAAREHVVELLGRVGIPRPERRIDAYSFELSGGMCQRVMVAKAMACSPGLLIADEPTTALDVTIQARILDLIRQQQQETGMSVLFITHDLGVVAEIADEVVVMYLGTVVERGSVDEIFHEPKHPYTRALLRSVPQMGAGPGKRLRQISGQVPHPSQRPTGCPFQPRCDQAIEGRCERETPPQVWFGPDRGTRCLLYEGGTVPAAQESEVTSG